MSLQRGSEIERARRRIEEQRRRSVEADLGELEHQRTAAEQARARQERTATERVDALLPASRALAETLRALEQQAPEIRRQPLHEVTVQLHQPTPGCVRVSLRWGTKFALTDTDKQLMHSYRTARRRVRRYPDVVVAHEYRELWAVLDGSQGAVRLSSGHVFAIEEFLDDPAVVVRCLPEALVGADRQARYHLRCTDYEASPARR
ncbi:MAG TPA: hypothetical protein VGR26_08670 [Acidimicrobiales bacterium]|nr:hypothetical protein [Acidimicrobiales bacterium]